MELAEFSLPVVSQTLKEKAPKDRQPSQMQHTAQSKHEYGQDMSGQEPVRFDMDGNPIMEQEMDMEGMDPYGEEMEEVDRKPYGMEEDEGATEDDLSYEQFQQLIEDQQDEGHD